MASFEKVLVCCIFACLSTCARPTPGERRAAVPPIALYAMDCGRFFMENADAYADDGSFRGVRREMVNPCYLIRHPAGDLLWDLGVPDALSVTRGHIRSGFLVLRMTKSLASQLHSLGLTPDDIELISISHGHLDHIGNGSLFRRATFLVDAKERAYMYQPEVQKRILNKAGPYRQDMLNTYSALERLKAVEIPSAKSYDVFGDGLVVSYPAPGHTPGHRVLLVRVQQAGPILLTGDLYHLAESREMRTVPRGNNRAETLASMDAAEKLASDTHARVIRQHVPEDFLSLPAFPEALR
jgi:N-acyl homoserine lactone hydrolase